MGIRRPHLDRQRSKRSKILRFSRVGPRVDEYAEILLSQRGIASCQNLRLALRVLMCPLLEFLNLSCILNITC
jgi:hypothetical protein